MNVHEAARAFNETRHRHQEKFRQHFNNRVTQLADERFWQLHSMATG